MLVVSDLHLAKAEHFRSKGLPVPPTVDMQTLSVLTDLMRRFKPNSLAFLGDLFHSAPNRAWGDFEHWLADEFAHGLKEGLLVRGNHDRAHDDTYRGMGMDVVDCGKLKVWSSPMIQRTRFPRACPFTSVVTFILPFGCMAKAVKLNRCRATSSRRQDVMPDGD